MSLYSAANEVSIFHIATDTPVLSVPAWPADERVDLRVSLIAEEVTRELLPAIARRDLAETADAIVDSIYVLLGAALEFGIPIHVVWDAVHVANMNKAVPQPDGSVKVIKRPDGKVTKPEGWTPPDVAGILRDHGYKG